MNARKIITIIAGIIISFGGLAFAISFLSSSGSLQNSTEITFTRADTNEATKINAGGSIAGKGNLTLGKYEILQLATEDSALELVSAEFNPNTNLLDTMRARVNSGSILAVNLIFGTELTLLDDRIAVTNHGGSLVFEKNVSAEKNSTSIRVLSGEAQLTFVNAANSETFTGVLLANEEINLDDETIAEIFATGDEIARIAAWRSKIGTFSSRFESESQLTSQLLAKLPAGATNKILDFLKEKLIFSTEKKIVFYTKQFAGALAAASNGDASKFQSLIATTDQKKRALLQPIAARAAFYTRLFTPISLPPLLKEKISHLSELSAPLASFAEVKDLPPEEKINRDLMLIRNDPTNANQAEKFLTQAKSKIEAADETSARLLLAILKINPQSTTEDWISAWSAINTARIIDNHDLANAVTDQLSLVNVLVKAGRKTLSGSTLKELASLLARASKVFDQSSLEMIAAAGNEFRSRILFLASLQDESPFDEDAYRVWLANEARLTQTEDSTEDVPENNELIVPTDDPNRISRPESELTKFLNIEFTESETQTIEEEMLKEDANKNNPLTEFIEVAPTTGTAEATATPALTPTTETTETTPTE